MLHKNASDKFSFESCKFTIQRSKESTGRFVYVEDNGDAVNVNLNLTKDCCYHYLESFQSGVLEHGNHELIHS